MDWKLITSFGDRQSIQNPSKQDLITNVKIHRDGNIFSLGDRSGRFIIFMREGPSKPFDYFTEVNPSPDFDALKSRVIEQHILDSQWLANRSNNYSFITTNSKLIKFWRLSKKVLKKVTRPSTKDFAVPKLKVVEEGYFPSLHHCFPCLHMGKVQSISVSHNQQFLLSKDKYTILLWNLDKPSTAFELINLNSQNEEDERISTMEFSNQSDSVLCYGTNKGKMLICDMRFKIKPFNSVQLSFPPKPKNFFSELIGNVKSMKFVDSNTVVARDILYCRLYDIRKPDLPTATISVNPALKEKLCQMYEAERFEDSFKADFCRASKEILTGTYNLSYSVSSLDKENAQVRALVFSEKEGQRKSGKLNWKQKTSEVAVHPTEPLAIFSCLNSVFIYGKSD